VDHSHHSSDPDLGRRGTLVLTHDSRQALLHRVGSDLAERLVQVPGEQADALVQGLDLRYAFEITFFADAPSFKDATEILEEMLANAKAQVSEYCAERQINVSGEVYECGS
jgi:hypothetical protein